MSTEENKTIVRRYFEEVHNERKYDVLDEIFNASWDIEAYKQGNRMFHSAFSEYHITIEDQIAEDDKVVTRWTGRSRHLGNFTSPYGDIPATDKQMSLSGITIDRVENNRIVERWYQVDFFGMLQQLGIVPASKEE